jgi:hypothetical protein
MNAVSSVKYLYVMSNIFNCEFRSLIFLRSRFSSLMNSCSSCFPRMETGDSMTERKAVLFVGQWSGGVYVGFVTPSKSNEGCGSKCTHFESSGERDRT